MIKKSLLENTVTPESVNDNQMLPDLSDLTTKYMISPAQN